MAHPSFRRKKMSVSIAIAFTGVSSSNAASALFSLSRSHWAPPSVSPFSSSTSQSCFATRIAMPLSGDVTVVSCVYGSGSPVLSSKTSILPMSAKLRWSQISSGSTCRITGTCEQ